MNQNINTCNKTLTLVLQKKATSKVLVQTQVTKIGFIKVWFTFENYAAIMKRTNEKYSNEVMIYVFMTTVKHLYKQGSYREMNTKFLDFHRNND